MTRTTLAAALCAALAAPAAASAVAPKDGDYTDKAGSVSLNVSGNVIKGLVGGVEYKCNQTPLNLTKAIKVKPNGSFAYNGPVEDMTGSAYTLVASGKFTSESSARVSLRVERTAKGHAKACTAHSATTVHWFDSSEQG